MEWISVNERLPNHREHVLFVFKDGKGDGAWFKYPVTLCLGDFFCYDAFRASFRHDCHDVESSEVTHWMPLPPAPTT